MGDLEGRGDWGLGNDREEYLTGIAKEIEAFLLWLEQDCDNRLCPYVKNRVRFLNEECEIRLTDGAKALLLESNYSVIKEVMKHRESQALRWVCVWVI